MKVLITGSHGKIGRHVCNAMIEAGHEIRTLDRRAAPPSARYHYPCDIQDSMQVRRAVMGCEAVVHLAAIPGDRGGMHDMVFATNVNGGWNILQAAAESEVRKVVYFSSIQAIGPGSLDFEPSQLPIDDNYPPQPRPSYGLSKYLGEEMCQSFTRTHGLSTYCLRPTGVMEPSTYRRWPPADPRRYPIRKWDCYAYVDMRDVASAVAACLDHPGDGFHGRFLLTADDTCVEKETADILRDDFPNTPWIGGESYLDHPRKTLVDCSAARKELGWRPLHSWQDAGCGV